MRMNKESVLLIVGGNDAELDDSLAAASRLQSILPSLGLTPIRVDAGPNLLEVASSGAKAAIVCMAGSQAATGHIHAVLSMSGIPYRGPLPQRVAPAASLITSRSLLAFDNIPVPPYITVKGGRILSAHEIPFTFPVRVRADSSPLDRGEVLSSLKPLQHHVLSRRGTNLILEPAASGTTHTIAVLVLNDSVMVTAELDGDSVMTPSLNPVELANIKTLAQKAVDALSLTGGPYIVHFITGQADPVVDHITVLPSLAPDSLLDRLLMAAGIEFTEWVTETLDTLTSTTSRQAPEATVRTEDTLRP